MKEGEKKGVSNGRATRREETNINMILENIKTRN